MMLPRQSTHVPKTSKTRALGVRGGMGTCYGDGDSEVPRGRSVAEVRGRRGIGQVEPDPTPRALAATRRLPAGDDVRARRDRARSRRAAPVRARAAPAIPTPPSPTRA